MNKTKTNYKERLRNIKGIVLDVDGVLTNGKVLLMSDGTLLRSMNVKDGYAMQLAIKKSFQLGVITGGSDINVEKRLRLLGLSYIYLKANDKPSCYKDFKKKTTLKDSEILYIGDDVPDILVIKSVGVSACPCDATNEVKEIVDYVSPKAGGDGCVRDVIEQTLKVQDLWNP